LKQIICSLEGWIRYKTVSKCKQMYFIPQMVYLIFGGPNINNNSVLPLLLCTLLFLFFERENKKKSLLFLHVIKRALFISYFQTSFCRSNLTKKKFFSLTRTRCHFYSQIIYIFFIETFYGKYYQKVFEKKSQKKLKVNVIFCILMIEKNEVKKLKMTFNLFQF
jgi:hypothetical protein